MKVVHQMNTRRAITKTAATVIIAIVVIAALSTLIIHYAIQPHQQVTTASTTKTATTTSTFSSATVTKHSTTTTITSSTTPPSSTVTTSKTTARGGIVVTDFRGKKVVLPKPAERIVVLSSYWAEVLVALGDGNKIVGIGKYVKYDEYLPESVRSKPSLGSLFSGINIEELVALKPDVVVMDIGYGNAGEVASKLEGLGIKVVGLFIHDFSDELRAVNILGKITGSVTKAKELEEFMSTRYEKLLSVAKTIGEDEKVTAVMISGYSVLKGSSLSLYANTSWGRALADVGAINLALKHFPSKEWPKIDFETLAKWDPDVIVVTSSVSSVQKVLDKIEEDAKWHGLKAYKTGRIYVVPCWSSVGGVMDWGPRDIIGREYLASIIYPSKYGGIDWRGDMEYLLKHFYGLFIPKQAFASYSLKWKEVVDLTNATVKIPREVHRAVDFISYVTLASLKVMNRVVGISKYAKVNKLLLAAYPDVKKIPSPGSSFSVNIEELIALKPDVVITWPYKESVVKEIEDQGIPVIKVQLYSYNDIKRLIWLMGVVFDVRSRAEELVKSMDSLVGFVQEHVADIPPSERVKVLYLWSSPTKVQGGRGTVNDFIRLAGGVNVAADAFPTKSYVPVDIETIVKWNPDVIVIWWWARYGPDKILHDPVWEGIKAVKEGKVYKEPYYEHWGVDAAIFILWLSMKLYPSKYVGVNFMDLANKYFQEWYGVPYSKVVGS